MNLEPQKLFIGVTDFFSILLPGSLLTYLSKDSIGSWFLGSDYLQIEGAEAWVIFLFASYLLGHFIFLLGSMLDKFYNEIRYATRGGQIKRLIQNKRLSPRWARGMARILLNEETDQAVSLAVQLKQYYLGPLGASSAVNAFQWCKARLTLAHPEAAATVQRFEADSKFFRSLLVVLAVLIPWGLFAGQLVISFVSVPVLILAFWRYVDQRLKATNQAYWYIITLESGQKNGFRQRPEASTHITHAGGVVFRRNKGQMEYLLVQAKNNPKEWVLPKGHIEPGENLQETAVREVREETGVWASIQGELNEVSFSVNRKLINAQFYLMEAVEKGESADKREITWLTLDRALIKASYEETRDLIRLAEKSIST